MVRSMWRSGRMDHVAKSVRSLCKSVHWVGQARSRLVRVAHGIVSSPFRVRASDVVVAIKSIRRCSQVDSPSRQVQSTMQSCRVEYAGTLIRLSSQVGSTIQAGQFDVAVSSLRAGC